MAHMSGRTKCFTPPWIHTSRLLRWSESHQNLPLLLVVENCAEKKGFPRAQRVSYLLSCYSLELLARSLRTHYFDANVTAAYVSAF